MPIRPTSDKEVEAVDLDRLFEQYVETDLLNHFNDRTPKQSTSDNTTHHFESSLSNGSECFGPEPILDRETQAAWHKALENQSSRRKSNHSSQQSSRQTSVNGGGVGFVNFTPDDSRKILTGVAPSGSSKTKARREKEAADKRRKLSRAAMKAVIEAGGDIDSLRRLEREGLLVMEG
ncbi:hypothetical protein J4E83_003309 [Alternaria metachromatica]|uniref:uncharacterized protein n=1 Tax=Alternaria metachromatica TaxID=283354 RepID=UPI0020C39B5F|nr:uncharacterized protein J4E83_003309 [Alternaria metachromatica]KAI4628756.1 hypothetical protein J4E83_003309 [Alternaria metachromatica]